MAAIDGVATARFDVESAGPAKPPGSYAIAGATRAGSQNAGSHNTALHNTASHSTVRDTAQAATIAERRRAPRNHVIKSARLVFGDNVVFNCLVLDESTGGVMVDLGAMVRVPEELTIQFAGGASYLAERRWMVGTKAGLKFLGGQVVTAQTAERMRLLAGILQSQGLTAAIQTLRAARFFDNTALREAAEAAESTYAKFEAVLTGRA